MTAMEHDALAASVPEQVLDARLNPAPVTATALMFMDAVPVLVSVMVRLGYRPPMV